MKLGLGTAQFGMDYGISNTGGRTPPAEAAKMLELAAQLGMRCLDTAPAYSVSEEVLGAALPRPHNFLIVSKTLKGDVAVGATLQRSLQRLKENSLDALLVHDGDALGSSRGSELFGELRRLKEAGLVKKIGTIVYTASQIDSVLERFPIDVIQLPISLLDQRLLRSGHLDLLKEKGVEIHARSVFLQGLLLLEPSSLPKYFDSVRAHLTAGRASLARAGQTMLGAALRFVLQLPQIDRVVVGATTTRELSEIAQAAAATDRIGDAESFAWGDERILNPALWPPRQP